MIKFVVVLYRRSGITAAEFRRYFADTHAPIARKLPGLLKYVQNFPVSDDKRTPRWDAVVELYFASRAAMEQAWATTDGSNATSDLDAFVDVARSSWAIVDVVDGLQ